MSPHQITELLRAWGGGDDEALALVTPLVHAELRQIARRHMRGERSDHTLQVTALVNECYLRLADAQHLQWQDRTHFLAWASRVMRRVLVDFARERQAGKQGGGAVHVPLDDARPAPSPDRDLVALDDALAVLVELDERKARVVELRFFGGLSNDEVAAVLGVSTKTVMRDWQLARVWLLEQLDRAPGGVV